MFFFFYHFLAPSLYFYVITINLKEYKDYLIFQTHHMKLIAVSVVIPVYNKYNFLERSLNSLKKQTIQNFEIIYIDDCSTDNSLTFLLDEMKQNPNIRVIQHTYNQGTCASRNQAVLASRGDYIMSLDPDDEYFPDSIENSYKNAIKYDADVLEFEIFVTTTTKNFTLKTCRNNFNDNTYMLTNLQEFNYYRTNWNVCKKIIRGSIYHQAVNLIIPFVENKRICNGEDLLHNGVIFILMKNYICGHFYAYLYYKGLEGSAFKTGYDSRKQSAIQSRTSKLLAHYFYLNRDDLSKCSLKDFLKDNNNRIMYENVLDIVRKPIKNCISNIPDIKCKEFIKSGYCLLERN